MLNTLRTAFRPDGDRKFNLNTSLGMIARQFNHVGSQIDNLHRLPISNTNIITFAHGGGFHHQTHASG